MITPEQISHWYILPGMGATSVMHRSLKRELSFRTHFLDWPTYRNEGTFKQVAKRVIAENKIGDADIVGGSSIGGMVALEVATIVNVKAVVLMGSAQHGGEVNRLLSFLSPLSSVIPFPFIQALAARHASILSQMFAASNPDFIKAMCRYVSLWPGCTISKEKIFRLHGEKDLLIKCPLSDCHRVENAGHFPTITHTKECAAFLEEIHRRFSRSSDAPSKKFPNGPIY